jgi:hypothetical protein
MQFVVVYKGLRRFTGSLGAAMAFVETNWTSAAEAYEIGVKLVPLPSR